MFLQAPFGSGLSILSHIFFRGLQSSKDEPTCHYMLIILGELPRPCVLCGVAAVLLIPILLLIVVIIVVDAGPPPPTKTHQWLTGLTARSKKGSTHRKKLINKPFCHGFTGTSAHDTHLSAHMFTELMKHTKSLTLCIQTHDKLTCMQNRCPPSFAWNISCQSHSLPHHLQHFTEPSGTLEKTAIQFQIAPDSKLGEKRAEVLKVSRRSDHLYESCAAKHRSPREMVLPTLQSLNKTLPWLYRSLPGAELSFRHMQQKAACLRGLDAKPGSVQYGAVQHDANTKAQTRVRAVRSRYGEPRVVKDGTDTTKPCQSSERISPVSKAKPRRVWKVPEWGDFICPLHLFWLKEANLH